MTDKELLLIDLSARLPYGVKVDHFGIPREVIGIFSDIVQVGYDINDYEDTAIEDIKPYLRPMSSMTDEEDAEFTSLLNMPYEDDGGDYEFGCDVDWLNVHHFDYRDLIEKGLAIEAPEGMYNIK